MEMTDVARGRWWSARVLLVATLLASCVVGISRPATADPASDAGVSVALINEIRWAHGLGQLLPDRELQIIANRQANRMANSGSVFHSGNLGSELSWGWWRWGENVGYGPSVRWIHNAFMNSSHHSGNILYPWFNYVGVGVAYGWDGTVYVAQVFGAW